MAGRGRTINEAAAARYEEHKAQAKGGGKPMSWLEADEARQQMPHPIASSKKYVFRSRPGTIPHFTVRIPHLPDDFKNEAQEKRLTSSFIRRRARIDGENPGYDLESIRAKVGGDYIVFRYQPGRRVPGTEDQFYRGTCVYETDDDEIYAYLMRKKRDNRNGLWSDIVVEYPKTSFEVNGQSFPATSAGWEAAQAAVMAGPTPSQKD